MLNRLRQLLNPDAKNDDLRKSSTPVTDLGQEPATDSKLGDFAIDECRPMKVITIGAGMSGILAGIRFRQHIPNVELTIYEKEAGVGGTWYANRYPGIACDVPSHCYQYTFEDKGDWSALYSPGAEIQEHLESVVTKYKLEPYIKLQHELTYARYDEPTGKWNVRIKRPSANADDQFEEFEDQADFLFMSVGILSRWSWPEIDGLKDFRGTLVHSANWNLGGATWEDDVKNWGDKSVAVIGLGSSALQIMSALQDKVKRLSQYARGKTWVSPPFLQEKISDFLTRDVCGDDNYKYTDEERKKFQDSERLMQFRRILDTEMLSMNSVTMRGSKEQLEEQARFREHMLSTLSSNPEIAEMLMPNFSVTARRLTPAPGYLKALCKDHVDLINTEIKRISADGIETVDGRSTKHDVIICATGYDVSYRFPFPIIGRNGVNLSDRWTPHPETYLSLCVDGFPNCFFSSGPNSCFAAGVFLPDIEHFVDYAVMVVQKMQRERLKSIEVKPERVRDFDEYIELYFPQTVFTEKVRSWYKMGKEEGRVVGLWPGSSLHLMRALRHPRWEDYNYERIDSNPNELWWLGNGVTLDEMNTSNVRAWFLDTDYINVPPIPA